MRELNIPPLVVPKKWEAALSEEDLESITPDTKKILLQMSKLQVAVNFTIAAQSECRSYQILIAEAVNHLQERVIMVQRSTKQTTGWGLRIKWALLIIGAVVLQELAKRHLFPGKP